jgi:hypothetical protein
MRHLLKHIHEHRHIQEPLKWVERWEVRSHSSNKLYTVSLANDNKTWGCSCPHWTRNFPRPICKHIREVQNNIEKVHDYVTALRTSKSTIKKDEFFTEEDFKL